MIAQCTKVKYHAFNCCDLFEQSFSGYNNQIAYTVITKNFKTLEWTPENMNKKNLVWKGTEYKNDISFFIYFFK